MTTDDNAKLAEISNIFYCEFCDYKTSRKYNLNIHLQSERHKNNTNNNNNNDFLAKISKKHQCQNCNKIYNDRAGLWRHKKKCDSNCLESNKKLTELDKDELIITLLKQNAELIKGQQDMMIKFTENGIINTINSHNTTNNNTFNLNFFLNETCKNAMNITDFVSSIQMNLEDLEHTGRSGYIEGISNIILKNLNKLEQHLRPLHCSDFKREVLYIKDNDEWLKETEDKPILTKAIKTIANENIKQINKWKDNYPDCIKSNSKKNYLYLKIVSNSMNGLTKQESDKNINKIITNVAKKVVIEK